MTKIIAFDPGSRWTGICVLFLEDGRPTLLGLEEIEAEGNGLMPAKVRGFLDKMDDAKHRFRQEGDDRRVIAVEKSIPPKRNAYSWELTARARGAIQSFVYPGIDYYELTAREVRGALGVRPLSRRSKTSLKLAGVRGITQDAQVKEKLCFYCGLPPKLLKSTHQVDALALAVVVGWRHYGLKLEEMKARAAGVLKTDV